MMLDGYYRNRLEKDLAQWQHEGWVDKPGSEAILNAIGKSDSTPRLPTILGFLGAVLIIFSAMTFVAANWEEIPRLFRLILLLSGMLISYALAWVLTKRNYPMSADTAVLIGTGIYGAAIMLVAQIYHIEAHYPDGVMAWSFGAILATALTLSRGAFVISITTAIFWSLTEMIEFDWDIHWPFIPVWVVLTALAIYMRWSPARHLTLMAILAWFVVATGQIFDLLEWSSIAALSFLMASAALLFAASNLSPANHPSQGHRAIWLEYASTARVYTLFSILGLAFLLRLAGIESSYFLGENPDIQAWVVSNLLVAFAAIGLAVLALRGKTFRAVDAIAIATACAVPMIIAYMLIVGIVENVSLALGLGDAVFVIVLAIWAIDYGHSQHSRVAVNLGLTTFGVEILYLYFETFGTLLDTAFFFLIGGILLIALGWLLNKFRLRLAGQEAAS